MTRILVVDDDKNTLRLYEMELTELEYDISTAGTAREALERFRSDSPDLVLLDIRMPGMDGLEVLARMLSFDRHLPIILISAYSHFRDNFLSWAADAYIAKSSDLSELKWTIARLLSRRKTGPRRPWGHREPAHKYA